MARFNQYDDLKAAEFIGAALPGARFVEADLTGANRYWPASTAMAPIAKPPQQSIIACQVPQTGWRKSSRSSAQADSNCVEARPASTGFQVRDSKLGDTSPIFDLGTADFTGLLRAADRD